ncbi:MAG: hypothetical protein AABY01_00835 [Nanoarchaeota archaeon]
MDKLFGILADFLDGSYSAKKKAKRQEHEWDKRRLLRLPDSMKSRVAQAIDQLEFAKQVLPRIDPKTDLLRTVEVLLTEFTELYGKQWSNKKDQNLSGGPFISELKANILVLEKGMQKVISQENLLMASTHLLVKDVQIIKRLIAEIDALGEEQSKGIFSEPE